MIAHHARRHYADCVGHASKTITGNEPPTADLGTQMAECSATLGIELTAYLAGASSPAQLHEWSRGRGCPPTGAAERLRSAMDVVNLFAAVGRGGVARSWLREVSAQFGGQSPAQFIRWAADKSVLDEVRTAAARLGRRTRAVTATGAG